MITKGTEFKESGEKYFLMNPKVDFCFKELIANEYVRRGFIGAVLGIAQEKVSGSTLLPTHLRRDSESDKLGILDILVRLKDGTRINMEIQIIDYKDWPERSLFYSGKTLTSQLRKGEPYTKIHKCIHIGILDFKLYPESKEYFTEFYLMDSREHRRYTDKLEIYVLELPKLKDMRCPESEIWQWGMFLNGKEEEIQMLAKRNKYIAEAYEELMRISADEEARLEYEAREKAYRDHISFMDYYERKGLREGEEKGIISIIVKQARKGRQPEETAEWLDEDIDKVRKVYDIFMKHPEWGDREICDSMQR